MSLYPPIRSLLFKMDPEAAHQFTLQMVRLAGILPPARWLLQGMFSAPSKPVEAFGLRFDNPVGLAAGYDKDGVAFQGLAALGFGHIEIGTVTSRPQPGNPKPRVFRLVEDEAVINRMGFPSRGTEFVQSQLNPEVNPNVVESVTGISLGRKIKKRIIRRDSILGVNLGKNKNTPNEEAVFDYLSLLQNYASIADYIAINVSSPNTVGLRSLQGREALHALLGHLHEQRKIEQAQLQKRVPLLVKLAPDLSEQELEDAVGVILETGMDGIIATNTTLSRDGLNSVYAGESGGLSGKPLRQLSDHVLMRVAKLVDGRIPVVGVGGIMTAEDARRKLDLGASLVQVYTGLIYSGPGLVKQILKNI